MKRFLFSPDVFGSFDFFSNVIVLDRYSSRDSDEIREALLPCGNWDALKYERYSPIRSLIRHEATHFLDMTTTRWGIEYLFRKLRLVDAIQQDADLEERARVFMLNTTEIEIHRELLQTSTGVLPSECTTLQHYVKYTERFGPVVMLVFKHRETLAHHVPISILSVLEAHATANEYLSQLKDSDLISDSDQRIVEQARIAQDFTSAIDDPERLEYSALIHLCKIHFSELSFSELLELVVAFARFSLDAADMLVSSFANRIEESFRSSYGPLIGMDLRRGMSRQVIFFKTVLSMYGWMTMLSSGERESHLRLLRLNPRLAIDAFLEGAFKIDVGLLNHEWDFEKRIEWFENFRVLPDTEILNESSILNRSLLHKKSMASFDMSEIMLPDMLLQDDTVITLPNRISLDILGGFDANLGIYSKLDAVYRERKTSKFHMDPLTARDTVRGLRNLNG